MNFSTFWFYENFFSFIHNSFYIFLDIKYSAAKLWTTQIYLSNKRLKMNDSTLFKRLRFISTKKFLTVFTSNYFVEGINQILVQKTFSVVFTSAFTHFRTLQLKIKFSIFTCQKVYILSIPQKPIYQAVFKFRQTMGIKSVIEKKE